MYFSWGKLLNCKVLLFCSCFCIMNKSSGRSRLPGRSHCCIVRVYNAYILLINRSFNNQLFERVKRQTVATAFEYEVLTPPTRGRFGVRLAKLNAPKKKQLSTAHVRGQKLLPIYLCCIISLLLWVFPSFNFSNYWIWESQVLIAKICVSVAGFRR